MLRVRCVKGWRAGAPWSCAPSPISRWIALWSSAAAASVVSGGKSTTRRIEPAGGGATPLSRAARSLLPEISAGVSSVAHIRVDTSPVLRSFWFGAGPSIRTTALPPASWPVTTRLTGFAMLFSRSCLDPRRASIVARYGDMKRTLVAVGSRKSRSRGGKSARGRHGGYTSFDRRRGTGGTDARRRSGQAGYPLRPAGDQGGARLPAQDGALQRPHHGALPPDGHCRARARGRPAARRPDGRVHRLFAGRAAAAAASLSVGRAGAGRDRGHGRRLAAARALPAYFAIHPGAAAQVDRRGAAHGRGALRA